MAKQSTRQKESKKISRSKAVKKRVRGLKKMTLIASGTFFLAFMAGGGWWLLTSNFISDTAEQVSSAIHRQFADSGFVLERVVIEGRDKTPQERVMEALDLTLGESIFRPSLSDIRERLQGVSTVKSASVERILPDTLHIQITERVPVAIWQNKGDKHVIDSDGVVLRDELPYMHRSLIVVTGEDAPGEVAGLLAIFDKQPQLAKRVAGAARVGQRRWNLTFSNSVNVLLPEDAPEEAWGRLAEMQEKQKILDQSAAVIDMRLEERIFIKFTTPDDAASKEKKPSAET